MPDDFDTNNTNTANDSNVNEPSATVDPEALTIASEEPIGGAMQDDTQTPLDDAHPLSDDGVRTSQVEEQINEAISRLRESLTTAVTEAEKQASEISALAERLRQMENDSKEQLATIQAALSDAKNKVEEINSSASTAQEVSEQLPELKSEIENIHKTATQEAEAITAIQAAINDTQQEINSTHTEISDADTQVKQLQSAVVANANLVSQHQQTALEKANSATAHEATAAEAAEATSTSQETSSAGLIKVQEYATKALAAQKQISDALVTAETELGETKQANTSSKQSLGEVVKNQGLAEAASQAAKNSAERTDATEKSANESNARITALEEAIKNINAAANTDLVKNRKEYDDLIKTINGLLPGATSAGLASAFRLQKESYDRPKLGYIALFVVVTLFFAFGQHFIPEDEWIKQLKVPWEIIVVHVLQKSPIEVGLVYLLYFAYRAFTTADKLQQDYAYKERIATIFEGFKTQFASVETPPGTPSLLGELCLKLLTIIGQHPARFYDPKHVEDLPSAEQVVKLMQATRQSASEAEGATPEKDLAGLMEVAEVSQSGNKL